MKISRVLFGKAKDICYKLDDDIVAAVIDNHLYFTTPQQPTRAFLRAADKLIAKAKYRDGVAGYTFKPGTVDATGTEIVLDFTE